VRLIGQGEQPQGEEDLAPALNPVLFEMPPLAVDAARRELLHLGERVADLLDAAIPAILDGQPAKFETLHEREHMINRHHTAIFAFIETLLQPELPPDVCRAAVDLVEAADYLESIGDLVDKEMIPLYRRHVDRGNEISPQARERLRTLAKAVGQELRRALRAVAGADRELARSVLETKSQVRGLEQAAAEFQVEPQPVVGTQRLLPNALERELAESLRRAYSLIRRFVRVGTGLLRSKTERGSE
jgi:phosphate:Na+ symporter